MFKILLCLLVFLNFLYPNPLQEAISSAEPGDIITLDDGVYEGNIVINKAITLQAKNRAVIRGNGTGSVIKIKSSNVSLINLKIENSGNSHTNIDAGISCENSNLVRIENNDISNSLFGIDFKQCNESKIVDNRITSKPVSLGLRGDAIRLWYSHNNEISHNYIYESRDMVIWYSSGNTIKNNYGRDGRYSLHFMYAGKNLVENNKFEFNSVGIFFMFSSGSLVRNNHVSNSTGPFGVGIGMKDTSDFTLENNVLMYNARGLYIDQSPFQPGTINTYYKNQILYNTTGVHFHATQHKSVFANNDLIGNMEIAINDTPDSKVLENEWRENYFDDYEGFDRDKDGYGDMPYASYSYADRLWQHSPSLRFFYGSTAISALNFLARLAPFSEPEMLLSDKRPKMRTNYE